MLERHECELISAGIDGELTPREQREHDELLAASKEARALHAELCAVGGLLESLPEAAPPPELAERVLVRTATGGANVVPIKIRWRRARLPLAFAAGLMVAVAVQRLLPPEPTPLEQQWMSGTLAPLTRLPGQFEQAIDVDGLSGYVSLGQRGDTRSLEFRLQSAAPLEIEVGLAGTGRRLGGVVLAEDEQGPDAGRIEFAGGTVRVSGDGAAAFGLLLPDAVARAGATGAIRVAIRSDGRVRYETTIGE
jgi:hypothetical protein